MDFTEAYADRCSSLGMAARLGDVQQLQLLLSEGRTADVADNRGWRPLQEAANAGSVECVKLLLQQDSTDVNWTSFDRRTALHLAVEKGNTECVKILLEAGANTNVINDMEHTPLHAAMTAENEDCMKLLVEAGADVNMQSFNGRSPLHQAAARGSISMVHYLLSQDAELDLEEDHQITPIFVAAQFGKDECLRVMLNKAKEKGQCYLVNKPAVDGATPLFLASQEGHSDCVKILLENGADANLATEDPPALSLHAAVEFEQIECINLLLPVTDLSGWTDFHPFSLACLNAEGKALQCLVNNGLDVNVKMNVEKDVVFEQRFLKIHNVHFQTKVTPLTVCALFKSGIKNAEILISAGAKVNGCIRHSLPPLLPAVHSQNFDLIKLLVSNGADMNVYHHRIMPNVVVVLSLSEYKGINKVLRMGAEVESCFLFHRKDKDISDCLKSRVCTNKDCDQCMTCEADSSVCLNHAVTFAEILSDSWLHLGSKGYFTLMLLLQFVGSVSLDPSLQKFVRTERQWKCLMNLTDSPRQLSHLCRLAVRSSLKPRQLVHDSWVEKLPIPSTMKDYLLYANLDDEITNCGSISV